MNDSNIQHYSDNILNSKQFISTIHTLFDISTSCLEPENKVLQEYVLRLPLDRDKFKTLSWDILNQHQSTFISRKSIDLCFIMKLLMIFLLCWRDLSQISTFYQHNHFVKSLCIQSECGKIRDRKTPNTDTFHAVNGILTGKKCCSAVLKLAFDKENVISKPFYIPKYENENH